MTKDNSEQPLYVRSEARQRHGYTRMRQAAQNVVHALENGASLKERRSKQQAMLDPENNREPYWLTFRNVLRSKSRQMKAAIASRRDELLAQGIAEHDLGDQIGDNFVLVMRDVLNADGYIGVDGNMSPHELRAAPFVGWHPDIIAEMRDKGALVNGGAPPVTFADSIPITAGVASIIGKSGVGKTPIAHAIATMIEVLQEQRGYKVAAARLSNLEPVSGAMIDPVAIQVSLMIAICITPIVVMDSLKHLMVLAVTGGGGGSGSGGISRGASLFLGELATVAIEAGCLVLTPINAATAKDTVYLDVSEAIMSNSSHIVEVGVQLSEHGKALQTGRARGAHNPTYARVTQRVGDGLERTELELVTTYANLVAQVDACMGMDYAKRNFLRVALSYGE